MKTKEKKNCDHHCIGTLFLDSGAHSLYTKHVIEKGHRQGYEFYSTKEFWAYVDDYAEFIKRNRAGIDYYVNVDVIFNPELSWKVQKYLEEEHGLRPVPVVHWGTSLRWLDKYLESGHDFIGLGGLGQEVTKPQYLDWADRVYSHICPGPKNLPLVKTHGFAMTAYDLMIRYPWFSVDSASWVKAGGFGKISVPHKRGGKFTFGVPPYNISVSKDSPTTKEKGRNLATLQLAEAAIVEEWLELIDIPLGSVDKNGELVDWGVVSHHAARKIANLKFYEALVDWLPEWPWPFRRSHRGAGLF